MELQIDSASPNQNFNQFNREMETLNSTVSWTYQQELLERNSFTPVSDQIICVKYYYGSDFTNIVFCPNECVLIYNKGFTGKRIMGNVMTDMDDDELTLSGSGLPTAILKFNGENEKLVTEKLIVMRFNPEALLANLSGIVDTRALHPFLHSAKRGVQFRGKTRDTIVALLSDAENHQGIEKIIILFKIINQFTTGAQYHYFNQSENVPVIGENNFKILVTFFNYAFRYYNNMPAISRIHRAILSRLLKKHYGCSIYQFINRLKVQHACSLLVGSEMSVKAVAKASGFESAIKFCKAFKRQMGITSKTYRLRQKQII